MSNIKQHYPLHANFCSPSKFPCFPKLQPSPLSAYFLSKPSSYAKSRGRNKPSAKIPRRRFGAKKNAAADATPEIKDAEKGSKSKSKSQYNDSSLAKIGGGGLTATRYDVAEKQLNESKKQSKLLSKIAENTEKQNSQNELLMR